MKILDKDGQPIDEPSKRTIKTTFTKLRKVYIGFAAVVASLAVTLSNIDTIKKFFAPPPPPITIESNEYPFSPDYMRLFGGIEVPFLMSLIGDQDLAFEVSDDLYGGYPYYVIPSRIKSYEDGRPGVINKDLVQYWKDKWKYKEAQPLLTDLWSEISGKKEAGELLYWRCLSPSAKEYVIYSMTIDESGDDWEPTAEAQGFQKTDDWVSQFDYDSPQYTKSKDVGFLFLILHYEDKLTAHELDININIIHNPLLDNAHFQVADPEKKAFTCPDPSKIALKTATIDSLSMKNRQLRSFKIANARTNDTFILLLGAYKADENGLPLFFITDYYDPVSIIFYRGGKRIMQNIRKPFGKAAAKIPVPYGWFGQ